MFPEKSTRFVLNVIAMTACVIALCPGVSVSAVQNTGHYLPGSEGIAAAAMRTVGESGIKALTGYYYADHFKNSRGDKLSISGDVDGFIQTVEYFYMSNHRIFGGSFGFGIFFAFAEADYNVSGVDVGEGAWGVADPMLTPIILAWQRDRLYWILEYGAYVPAGSYDENEQNNVGKGYWSHMITLGATYFVDEDKKWSITLIPRYEIHSKIRGTETTPGQNISLDISVGRKLADGLDVGLAGYGQWQISKDSVSDAGISTDSPLDRVLGVGPEIVFSMPEKHITIGWRGYVQFAARDRVQGYSSLLELRFGF
jgi:hypothetical protein